MDGQPRLRQLLRAAVRAVTCPCGQPLHYQDDEKRRLVQALVDDLGEDVPVQVEGKGTFLMSRHYIALHGLKAEDVDLLGFPRLPG